MLKNILHIALVFCFVQVSFSQEDGVVALNLPVRNSLKFNQYVVNPTFSFVRQQNKYISFSNKREWMQFDDAPQTYLFSYSGRFKENSGMGVGFFQQNYGVLTTFGGVLNYAYNAVLNRDSNLTFGMNLAFYQSGLNTGRLIGDVSDASLDNTPTNSIITVNPGINYGTGFFDFGVSLNNIVSYNLKTSKMLEDNPEQSIQGHIMYTGYVDSRGFFDESKFSSLVRSEFKNDITVISGIVMLTVPKGIWAQAGYNTLYGFSAGVGFNISSQIALEYNYEKSIDAFSNFGSSHDITLAYKFKNKYRYDYSGDDDEEAFIIPKKKTNRAVAKRKVTNTGNVDRQAIAEAKIRARAEAEEKAKAKAADRAKLVEAVKAEREALVQEKVQVASVPETEAAIEIEEDNQAKLEEAARLKAEEEEARLKAEEANRLRLAEEAKAKLEEEAQQLAAAKAAEEAQAKLAESERVKTEEVSNSVVPEPIDAASRAMSDLAKSTEDSRIIQQELIERLTESVAIKEQDLKDLKEENDLSEQGIFSAPKAFKSVTAENAALESLKEEIDNVLESQGTQIAELEKLYNARIKELPNKNDEINAYYLKTIEELKADQSEVIRIKQNLVSELESIKIATDFERKRRIKRAAYDNEQDRYVKDRAALKQIQEFTPQSSEPLSVEDFDFGEEQNKNIQILKDVKNVENGYYLVLAVHSDVAKRDEFLTKAVSLGQTNIDFFYDVNTSKYFIYYNKFNDVEAARQAMESKESAPYNDRMSMVKIEN